MPTDDYTSVAGGGLRLKGVNPSSKISKHKKKRPKPAEAEKAPSPSLNPSLHTDSKPQTQALDDGTGSPDRGLTKVSKAEDMEHEEGGESSPALGGKTEAELRHEERRRRRLEERLKREGTKTHKERVEEFNHYLSNLSEHHDMPRIGPG
ncbi:MAG: hypothetical protein Q9166_003733 [cf. Caloplaca sp. 2 TL-2023]